MATLQNMIASLRTMAHDGPDSKLMRSETMGSDPQSPIDGTNINFRLTNFPVIEGSIFVTVTGAGAGQNTFRDQTNVNLIDAATGVVTLKGKDGNPFVVNAVVTVDYNYIYCTDDDLGEFLNEATGNLLLNATADPTTVSTGLVPALMQYALANYYRALYGQWATRYSSSGGQSSQAVESVAKTYLAAAAACEKLGDAKRDAFYTRQGQRLTPAYGGTNAQGSQIAARIDPISPIR